MVLKMKKNIMKFVEIAGLIVIISFIFASCVSVDPISEDNVILTSEETINQELSLLTNPFVFIDFEALVLATTYNVTNFFFEDGAKMTVAPFQWSNLITTTAGYARVDNTNLAGHTGKDMRLNNVRLDFDFPINATKVIFYYGEYGGNVNLMINGNLKNSGNLMDFDGSTINGVDVYVVEIPVSGGVQGIVLLKGPIINLEVGGQEFNIDHVGFKS
jgi:hypothetical protein